MNNDHPVTPFAGLLHKCWEKHHEDATRIIGYWSEDNSTYHITVPHQIRDSIVAMQNWLARKYIEIERIQRQLSNLTQFFK